MEYAAAFTQGFLFSLSLCFDLGIVNIAIIKSGIERGFQSSFAIGFGSCFGDLTYLTLALLGVSVIFDVPVVKWSFWIAGSIVLLYLTLKMLRETWRPKPPNMDQAPTFARSFGKNAWTGFGLAISSPTVIAWFALIAGPIVAHMDIVSSATLTAFVIGFFAAGLAWSFSIALASSMAGAKFGGKMTRVLSLLSALLFLYFAIQVFMNGLGDALHS